MKKVPLEVASEVLLALGPDVRNPSAVVTKKLITYTGATPKNSHNLATAGIWPEASPIGGIDHSGDGTGEVFMISCGAFTENPLPLVWVSSQGAALELLGMGVLDEMSADYLAKAPEHEGKEVVAKLNAEVRNPPAFVTKSLKYAANARVHGPAHHIGVAVPSFDGNVVPIHVNGQAIDLTWESKDQALQQLVEWQVLDETSADYLAKASEHEARTIVAALDEKVRNPSAFVTKKMKELQQNGPLSALSGLHASGASDEVQFYHQGNKLTLTWSSKEVALEELKSYGILDDVCIDYLMKTTDYVAKDIISQLGPDVRNPSAFVTKKLKGLQPQQAATWAGVMQAQQTAGHWAASNWQVAPSGQAPAHEGGKFGWQHSGKATCKGKGGGGGLGKNGVQQPVVPGTQVTVYLGGAPMTVDWHSREQVLQQLMEQGILDKPSTEFLAKISEQGTLEILSNLGPDVRNPSAYATKEAKKYPLVQFAIS